MKYLENLYLLLFCLGILYLNIILFLIFLNLDLIRKIFLPICVFDLEEKLKEQLQFVLANWFVFLIFYIGVFF